MKKCALWALLLLLLLLTACGQPEKEVAVDPPILQETEQDAQPSIPEEPTAQESKQETQVSVPAESTEQETGKEPQPPTSESLTEPEAETMPTPPDEPEPAPEPETESPLPSESKPEESAPPEATPPQTNPTLLPILMYHHVVPDGTACNSMTVTAGKLAGDLTWLTEHGYTTVLPRDLAAGMPLPEKAVMITFDDGYRSNYELAYPLLQQYQTNAVISIMVFMQEAGVTTSLSWDMCREMSDSGLVEIGSHAYRLHNLDERNGSFTPGGINGIQRYPEESAEAFQLRVLDDLQKSHDLIEENLGQEVTFFAYPFGIREPDAQELIDSLFPVTVVTATGSADIANGIRNMPRWTVTMNTSLSSILKA